MIRTSSRTLNRFAATAVCLALVLLLVAAPAWLSGDPKTPARGTAPRVVEKLMVSADTTAAPAAPAAPARSEVEEPDRPLRDPSIVDVKLARGASRTDVERIGRRLGFSVRRFLPQIGYVSIESSDGRAIPSDTLEVLKREGLATSAQATGRAYPAATPGDPRYGEQWGFKNSGQLGGVAGADARFETAWDWARGDGIVVAVVDEGVMHAHPDLAGRMWVNADEVAGNGVDDDANGYVDDINGWDFVNDDGSVWDESDGDAHGTHVAGTIAASAGNGKGGVGSAWNAQLMSLKALGPNGGTYADLAAAIVYAVDNGAIVSNNSYGGSSTDSILASAVSYAESKGHLMVCAAGNSAVNADTTPMYPAAYPNTNIVSVAAHDRADALASYSNYGASSVDLGAPGTDILSTKTLSSAAVQVQANGAASPYKAYSLHYYAFPLERLSGSYTGLRDRIIDHSLTSLVSSPTASVLVVNDSWHTVISGDSDYTAVYTQRLSAQGYTQVTTWNTATQGVPALSSYDTVVWFTGLMSGWVGGSSRLTLTSTERTAMSNYLSAGGKVLIASAELGEDMESYLPYYGISSGRTFYRTYLRSMLCDTTHQNEFRGTAGGPFAGETGWTPDWLGAANTDLVGDSVSPRSGATPTLHWTAEYVTMSGTSMAAPHVTGAVALAWARTPDASMTEIRERLLANTRSTSAMADRCVTGGVLDTERFVGRLLAPSLDATRTGPTSAVVSWGNDDADAYFSATRVLARLDAPVAGRSDASATVLYEGTGRSVEATDLASGTWHFAAFSRNSLGSWTDTATAMIFVDRTPLVVPADPPYAESITGTFPDWYRAGGLTATRITPPAALPSGMRLVRDGCYDISADVGFEGTAELRIRYDAADLTAEQESGVRLLHYVDGRWSDITTSVSESTDEVVGQTQGFSPFAVVVPLDAQPSSVVSVPGSATWSVLLALMSGIAVTAARARIRVA